MEKGSDPGRLLESLSLSSQDQYRLILDNLYDGVYLVKREGKILFWNRGAELLTGYPAAAMVGHRCTIDLLAHTDPDGRPLCGEETCPAQRVMREGQPAEQELFLRHREGHRIPVRTRISPVRDSTGRVVAAVEVFSDISRQVEDRQMLATLSSLVMLDELTGLGNRRYAEQALAHRLAEMERYGWPMGLLFLDVDHFKQINDEHGHMVGDQVLRTVARTLRHWIRSFDVVARWGGEEFLVLLTNITATDLQRKAHALRALIAQSTCSVNGISLSVTVSIGATLAQKGEAMLELVSRTDRLMYESKRQGRNTVTM